MNNKKRMSLGSLSLLLLLRLLELFVVCAQIHLFHQQQEYHLLSSMSFQSPNFFKMICLINNEKLMSLGGLSLLLFLVSLLLLVVSRFATFFFHFFYQWQYFLLSPKSFKMISLINNKKLMNLGRLESELLLLAP